MKYQHFKTYTPLLTIYLYRVYDIARGDFMNKEKECCKNKKTVRSDAEKKIINNRLNRIEGQIRGIKNMVAEDRYCNDILIQLSAIESSIKSLSMHILENHLYSCITDSIEKNDTEVIDELMSLFKRFNK